MKSVHFKHRKPVNLRGLNLYISQSCFPGAGHQWIFVNWSLSSPVRAEVCLCWSDYGVHLWVVDPGADSFHLHCSISFQQYSVGPLHFSFSGSTFHVHAKTLSLIWNGCTGMSKGRRAFWFRYLCREKKVCKREIKYSLIVACPFICLCSQHSKRL